MKTKHTNLAILTFFSSVLTTENLLSICRAFYLLPLHFFFCPPCFLTSQFLSFSVSSLVCLSFCGTTKKPRSLEPGGGWDLSLIHLSFLYFVPLHTLVMFRPLAHTPYVSSPCTHSLCFVPLHTLLMFRPLAHTPYVSSPCTHSLCFVPLHTLLMFRPPGTFFSNHQMQKEGRISLSFHQPLSMPIEDEEE